MEELVIGFDGSLRSSGIVALNTNKEIVMMDIFAPKPKEYDNEKLILRINFLLDEFLTKLENNNIDFYYERASFAAKSAMKDLIAAVYWTNRIILMNKNIPITMVSVEEWRKHVLTIEEKREIRNSKIKNGLKELTYQKLPKNIKEQIDDFILEEKLKKEAKFDLTDAYWIACFGVNSKIKSL